MAILREDVVSIGFDVQENPFAGLMQGIDDIKIKLGIFDDTEDDLREIGTEARTTQKEMENLANGIDKPSVLEDMPEPLRETQKEAVKAKTAINGLEKEMSKTGKVKLDRGVKSLADGIKKPVTAMQGLAKGAKEAGDYIKEVGLPHALHTGLDSAAKGAKKLAGGLKEAAGVGFKGAVSGLRAVTQEAGKAAGALGKGALKNAGKLVAGVTAGVAVAGTAVTGLGGAAVSVGSGFEASMSQVAATMGMTADEANYSNAEYTLLAKTAKEMGAATKFSAAESAEALNYMALAGYDAQKACGALPTVLNLASAGGMELAAASDMITDSMSALGIEATQEELTRFGDQLAKTAQKSNTSVAQLGEAVLTVGGTAKTLAGGTTELNTLLGIIADNGVKGAEGGTALRNIMLSLQAPTDTAAKKMKSLGLRVYDAEGKMRPMNDILNDLNHSMDGMTDQKKQDIISTIFNKNDLKSVNALLDNSGSRFDELSGFVLDSENAMADMADTMNDNLTGRITEFKSAAEGTGIAIYEALGSGNLKGLVQEASGWITELTRATEKGGISGLAKAAGGVLSKVLVTVTGFLPDIVDMGAGIIESLLDGLVENEDQITASVIDTVMSLGKGILRVTPKLLTAGIEIVSTLAEGLVTELPALLPVAADGIDKIGQGLKENAPRLMGAAVTVVNGLLNHLTQAAPQLIPAGVEMIGKVADGLLSNITPLLSGAVTLVFALGQGLINSIPVLIPAAVNLVHGLVQGLVSHVDMIVDGSISLVEGLLTGLIENAPAIIEGGVQIVVSLVGGLMKGIPALISAGPKLTHALIEKIKETDWLQLGIDIAKGVGKGVVNGIKGLFGKNKDSGKETMESLSAGIDEGQPVVTASTKKVSGDITAKIDSTDLYGSGQNIMSGLNDGMLKMQPTLNATAISIGTGISNSLNGSLDIHSPSGVTEETGEYTGLGLVKGIEGTGSKIKNAARTIGDMTAENITPYKSRYSPRTSQPVSNSSASQVNNWNPVFNLTLNGASASDSNERKVKRWMKESLKEAVEGMGRTNPRLQEV